MTPSAHTPVFTLTLALAFALVAACAFLLAAQGEEIDEATRSQVVAAIESRARLRGARTSEISRVRGLRCWSRRDRGVGGLSGEFSQ